MTYTIHDYPSVEERRMHTVPFINHIISSGNADDMILVCEAMQEKTLAGIAERIASSPSVKAVLLAGP